MDRSMGSAAPEGTVLLHRFTVKPRHLDDWLARWPEVRALRERHGFVLHQGYVETDAEPKVTLLWSHTDPARGRAALDADAAASGLHTALAPHVFRNTVEREVRAELLTPPVPPDERRTVVMRRYAIVGGWEPFLRIWRRIVPVRERHGFRVLFAVADEPHDLFTWAFDYEGDWAGFPEAQRGYYRDPARVELRGVFDHMADYSLHPARPLPR
ncbi:MAG: hypothetical protein QM708_06670 [Propioniciclava sp.]|uniref:hypothetical protein n=1 Tax=Propioniciclava sp. TaxID=2038686 RepID=UPI0039E3D004